MKENAFCLVFMMIQMTCSFGFHTKKPLAIFSVTIANFPPLILFCFSTFRVCYFQKGLLNSYLREIFVSVSLLPFGMFAEETPIGVWTLSCLFRYGFSKLVCLCFVCVYACSSKIILFVFVSIGLH